MTTVLPQNFDSARADGDPSPTILEKAIGSTRELIWLFWGNAIDSCLKLMDETTLFIGPFTETPTVGLAEIGEALRKLRAMAPPLHILTGERYDGTPFGEKGCSITAKCSLEELQASMAGQQTNRRPAPEGRSYTILCSLVWVAIETEGGALRLASLHCTVAQPLLASALMAEKMARSGRTGPGGDNEPPTRIPDSALQTTDSNGISHWFLKKDVVYVKAAHQYTDIYCTSRRLRIRASFSSALEQLGDTVVRVHRSYAVNPAYLSHMRNSTLYLTTGDHVPVPGNRKRDVRKMLLQHSTKLGARE